MAIPLRLAVAIALVLPVFVAGRAQAAAWCDPITAPASCIGQPCNALGTTALDSDKSSIIGCLLTTPNVAATDCTSGCLWQANPASPLIHLSFELVGAGGGGGSADSFSGRGGNGAAGQIQQFDAWLHRGAALTLSVGSGGGGGIMQAWNFSENIGGDLASVTPGGSGLYARGGEGGVGPVSGSGGGGGAASAVIGDGLFAVAGGGGGGGGGAGDEPALNGNQDWGGPAEAALLPLWPKPVPGLDGAPGLVGCSSATAYDPQDGGGGGGGGGGYPGGKGGFWGCDSYQYDHGLTTRADGSAVSPGYPASGGANGTSYLYSSYETAAFSQGGNSAGVGGGGAGSLAGPEGSPGQCGRITIWSSTGVPFRFDCNAGPPVWIVQ
jgi:hypothetical protein